MRDLDGNEEVTEYDLAHANELPRPGLFGLAVDLLGWDAAVAMQAAQAKANEGEHHDSDGCCECGEDDHICQDCPTFGGPGGCADCADGVKHIHLNRVGT